MFILMSLLKLVTFPIRLSSDHPLELAEEAESQHQERRILPQLVPDVRRLRRQFTSTAIATVQ